MKNIKDLYYQFLPQFSRFVLVGFLNTAIDFSVLNLLIKITGITKGLAIVPLNAIAFIAAVTNSYFWNRFWVFPLRKTVNPIGQLISFLVVTVTGIIVNSGIVYVGTTVIGSPGIEPVVWANIWKVAATAVSLVWNFTGYKLIVFVKSSR